MIDGLIVLTILVPWIGAITVLALGNSRHSEQHLFAVLFAVATAICAVLMLTDPTAEVVLTIDAGAAAFGEFTFVADGLGVFLAVVAAVIGSLAVIFSVDYMQNDRALGRYYAMVLAFIGAMAGLALTGSLFLLFIFWEITALCSYGLISFYNDDPKAVEGGIKALVVTQLGGVGMLAGALAAYVYLGDFQIATLLEHSHDIPSDMLNVLAFGFLAAAAAKSAQFPFHTWLPGAMEAPSPVSALIHAATMVNAGVYLLARFYPAFEHVEGWTTAVIAVGAISAFMAALMALTASDLKRTLAYSTVSQLGYMVYAVGVGGVFSSQFHLLSHAVFKALLFLAAGAIIHSVGTRDMFKMGALHREMPFMRTVFIIGAFALAGLPIFNGFWSKELILEDGYADGPLWAYLMMLVGAGITALYTIRMIWLVFYAEKQYEGHAHPAGPYMKLATGLLAAGVCVIWVLAGDFGHMLEDTLPHHHLHIMNTTDLAEELFTAPATYVALGVVAAGIALWVLRGTVAPLGNRIPVLPQAVTHDFGFEWINRQIVQFITAAANILRRTQTGHLNWNVLGILGGLIVVTVVLWLGA